MKLTKTNFTEGRLVRIGNTGNLRPGTNAGRKKTLFLLTVMILLLFMQISAYSQTLTSVNAASGSLAPWGENQGLSINASGSTQVFKQDIETGVKVSASILLTPTQMQAIADTATAAGFFSLSTLHDSGALDGSGITLEITTSAAANTVETRNICVTAMNRVVRTINLQIISTGIQLNYGYLNEVCP